MGYPVEKLNENELKIRVTELRKEVRRLKKVIGRISEMSSRAKMYWYDNQCERMVTTLNELTLMALNNQGE